MRTIAINAKKDVARKLEIKFLLTPIEIKGQGKVEEIIFQKNKIKNGNVTATNETFSIKTGLVISAIGYDSIEFPGITIESGRITNIAGHVERNVYTVGWAKRGPTGVIGTNKSDSNDVVDLIIENLKEPKNTDGIIKLLETGHEIINQQAWEKINNQEIANGKLQNKPRSKIVYMSELIQISKQIV